jgi:polar amino acid transport system substrate-binding protein
MSTCRAYIKLLSGIWLIAGLLGLGSCHARSLADIVASGTLVVGVKKDVPLWGYQDLKSGVIAGMEVDLARDLAKRLGTKLETVGLRTDERIDAIRSGRVDILVATLSDTPERREKMTLVSPHYYSSGVNLLSRKNEHFREWAQLKNRKICGRRGAFYNRPVTVKYGVDIVALHSLDWATRAFIEGRCSALIYDDTAIAAMLKDPFWSQTYEMPMTTLYPTPWSIAIPKAEAGSLLNKAVSDAIIAWHREGFLTKLEKQWGIPASVFVRGMNAVWDKKSSSGDWYCGSEIQLTTPTDCLVPTKNTANERSKP